MAVIQVKRVEMGWNRNMPACAGSQGGEERMAHLDPQVPIRARHVMCMEDCMPNSGISSFPRPYFSCT